MIKQNLIIAALVAALGISTFVSGAVFAVEGQELPPQSDGVMPLADDPDVSGELSEPTDYPEESDGDIQDEPINEDGDNEGENDEIEEPATWPMYVSLGALGFMVVVFIILNLFGGRKKK